MLNESIKEIGEKELIKRISKYMPNQQTSDDCAFLSTSNKNLLINTDLMVENTHFNKKIISPRDLGWKAVITNYSDLISSGCNKKIGISIGLVLKPSTKWSWVKDLYEGINDALSKFGGYILGGDCSKGNNTIIAINAIGIQSELKLRRYACKPTEVLLTTGLHGLSKLGFLIQSGKINYEKFQLSEKLIQRSISAFCRPEPKSEILKKIIKSSKGYKIDEIGCTDSSDGLYQAILDLATESNCKAIIDYKKIPKSNCWPQGYEWDNYYFFGGEDYELLFSLPKNWADELLKIDKNIKEIGYFEKGNPCVEIKNCPNADFLEASSYVHF